MTHVPALHHVMIAIPAGGEHAVRDFYIQTLQLIEIPKPLELVGRGGLWVSTGSIDLHFGIDANFIPARKAHIALLMCDLDLIRDRLAASGFEPGSTELELPGFRRCYVDDPFGNRIELLESL